MNHRILLSAAFLLVVCLLGVKAHAAAQPLEDCAVIGRVNGHVILACELSWEVELMMQQRMANIPPEQLAAAPPEVLEQLRTQLMQQLLMGRLDMVLFYSDFRASVPQADLKGIAESLDKQFENQEIPQLMEQVGVEERSELDAKLYALGTTLAERREDFNKKMIARSWLTETVEFDREVTHEDMLEFYQENDEAYARPERARWEELMIRYNSFSNKEAAYAAIARLGNEAYRLANAKAPNEPAFAELAKRASHGFSADKGGYHDWTNKGAMTSGEINQALSTLPPGQMSPILEGPLGFHIVRVLERQPAGKVPFEDVQILIRRKIRDERFSTAVKQRVNKLKRDARVWTVYTGDIDMSRVAQRGKESAK